MKKQKRFLLSEAELPRQWYNIQAEMPNKPLPPLHPGTKAPLSAEDLFPIFAEECARQELNQTDAFIDIPEAVLDKYRSYRSTPLVRAYDLERTLCDMVRAQRFVDEQVVNPAMKAYVRRRDRDIPKLLGYARELGVEAKIQTYVRVLL